MVLFVNDNSLTKQRNTTALQTKQSTSDSTSTSSGREQLEWISNWNVLPEPSMHSTDVVWLKQFLTNTSTNTTTQFYAWYHCTKGGYDTRYNNDILHSYTSTTAPPTSSIPSPITTTLSTKKLSLEKRLFHELHQRNNSLSIKEFNECWAFATAVTAFYGKQAFDVIYDVAGGHGALGAILLILTNAKEAVVIDPANVGGGGVSKAWKTKFFPNQTLRYNYTDLRQGLPNELQQQSSDSKRVLVVACHACQHLSDETVEIACSHGVHVTVMPCCQKDTSSGSHKAFCKSIDMNIGPFMDILLAGKVSSWNCGDAAGVTYQVKLKAIPSSITPQNRMILCKAKNRNTDTSTKDRVNAAHAKLEIAYRTAHRTAGGSPSSSTSVGGTIATTKLSMMKFAQKTIGKLSREVQPLPEMKETTEATTTTSDDSSSTTSTSTANNEVLTFGSIAQGEVTMKRLCTSFCNVSSMFKS